MTAPGSGHFAQSDPRGGLGVFLFSGARPSGDRLIRMCDAMDSVEDRRRSVGSGDFVGDLEPF